MPYCLAAKRREHSFANVHVIRKGFNAAKNARLLLQGGTIEMLRHQ
jgi:hypothetical protein